MRPLCVSWKDAPAAIETLLSRRTSRALGGALVAITGPVGSGKSSLAARLSACVLSTDDFLPDHETVMESQRDEADAADMNALGAAIGALREGREAMVPVWSFQTHRREGTRVVTPANVVVVEGIHAFAACSRLGADLSVYVDAPAHLRLARWRTLEERGERGWGVERATAYFHAVAEPTFARHAPRWRALADILVESTG